MTRVKTPSAILRQRTDGWVRVRSLSRWIPIWAESKYNAARTWRRRFMEGFDRTSPPGGKRDRCQSQHPQKSYTTLRESWLVNDLTLSSPPCNAAPPPEVGRAPLVNGEDAVWSPVWFHSISGGGPGAIPSRVTQRVERFLSPSSAFAHACACA